MDHSAAVKLINHPYFEASTNDRWADLGSGQGTFTKALADLLGEGSTISAVDTDEAALRTLPQSFADVQIETLRADFVQDQWPEQLDGILMANSLHFVVDQSKFIDRLRQHLKPNGKLILIEYDTDQSNPWVPYPRSLARWCEFFLAAGFSHISEIARHTSLYQRAEIVGIWVD